MRMLKQRTLDYELHLTAWLSLHGESQCPCFCFQVNHIHWNPVTCWKRLIGWTVTSRLSVQSFVSKKIRLSLCKIWVYWQPEVTLRLLLLRSAAAVTQSPELSGGLHSPAGLSCPVKRSRDDEHYGGGTQRGVKWTESRRKPAWLLSGSSVFHHWPQSTSKPFLHSSFLFPLIWALGSSWVESCLKVHTLFKFYTARNERKRSCFIKSYYDKRVKLKLMQSSLLWCVHAFFAFKNIHL